jgi:hypothetical protein
VGTTTNLEPKLLISGAANRGGGKPTKMHYQLVVPFIACVDHFCVGDFKKEARSKQLSENKNIKVDLGWEKGVFFNKYNAKSGEDASKEEPSMDAVTARESVYEKGVSIRK